MMNESETRERMEKLAVEINKLRYEYHVLDKPDVTDVVYDSLMKELRELEERYPDSRSADSPTQRIGGRPLDKFKKVTHQVRQWSFNDVFDYEELKKWEEKIVKMLSNSEVGPHPLPHRQAGSILLSKPARPVGGERESLEYVCELKIDGLKVILTYEDGVFVQGATRGDGLNGEDMTENLKRKIILTYRVSLIQ